MSLSHCDCMISSLLSALFIPHCLSTILFSLAQQLFICPFNHSLTTHSNTLNLRPSSLLPPSLIITPRQPKTHRHYHNTKMCRHNACRTCDDPLPIISCRHVLRSKRHNCSSIKLPHTPERRPWCTKCLQTDSRILCQKPWYKQWKCGYGNCKKEYLVLCELLWHRMGEHGE